MTRGRVYNRIYSDEEWVEVNQINIATAQDWIDEYKQRRKKASTIKQYSNDVRIILIYIKRHLNNRNILELNKKDFRNMSIWFSDDLKLSNARANGLMSCVRSLLTFCEEDDEYDYDNNIAKKVKGLPKEAVRTDENNFFLSFKQVMKLRDELVKRGKLQHAVLEMMLYDSAGRRNEIFQINKEGLLDGNKTNMVIGKRGKSFPLVYLNDTREFIKSYLEERGNDNIDCLWIIGEGENKRSATYDSLYDRVVYMSKVLSEIEGKTIEFFPHSFRHSRIECLLQGLDPRIIDPKTGKPKKFTLEEVQKFAHHSDPKTTQDYSKDHTEEEIDSMFGF